MARNSRYGVEIADRIVECISLGYTLQDTAYAVGVSDETIRRWRDRYVDFNKRVVETSNRQWESPETLVKYKNPSYRSYRRRKIALSPDYGARTEKDQSDTEKPLLELEFTEKCSKTDERVRFCRKGHFTQIYLLEPAN